MERKSETVGYVMCHVQVRSYGSVIFQCLFDSDLSDSLTGILMVQTCSGSAVVWIKHRNREET